MNNLGKIDSGQQHFPIIQNSSQVGVDFSKAREAYEGATTNAQERHAEVGILSPSGSITFEKLGKNEEYGAHRVGSVTKTFTAFLAMKLVSQGIKLANESMLSLETKCGDVIPPKVLEKVFEDPESAANMTLEQLLSHTSGLELDDHARPQDPLSSPLTLQDRFLQEPSVKEGRKYVHVSKPGDGIGFYSNAGLAVAGWMMETAYNNKHGGTPIPFSEIMKKEIFEGVFRLEKSFIGPGPTGDIIQSACGDMTSSTSDLMKVAVRLREGESSLEADFGKGWQATMLKPRDLFEHHGLGCSANSPVIKHAGLNREKFGLEERDVTALVQFPLHPGEPGLVALCDSCALGPAPQEQRFIKALEESAGISKSEEKREPVYELDFFCPQNSHIFHGNAYLATDVDPFAKDAPDKIICSRNGMKHELTRDLSIDRPGIRGYRDENKEPWLCISKGDGSKIIYSSMCLLTNELDDAGDIAIKQPNLSSVQALQGVYRDSEAPEEHPTYRFTEEGGRLYMKDGNDKDKFPCLFIPDESGGSWVVSNPSGRSIKIQFPENPDEGFLMITDILTGIRQLPFNSKRT